MYLKMTALFGGLIYYQLVNKDDGTCRFNQRSTENMTPALFYSLTTAVVVGILASIIVSTVHHSTSRVVYIYRMMSF